ncbi:MAG: phage tail length tape measure family protein [candidate division FCPU426 bacterium]
MPAKPLELVAKGKDQGATALIDKIIAKSKQLGLAQTEMEGATTAATRKATVERQVMYERMFKSIDAADARATVQREKEEKLRQTLQKRAYELELRDNRDYQKALAYGIENQFERQKAMQIAQFNYEKALRISHNESIELLEVEHGAKMASISAQAAVAYRKPFNTLLAELATLTGLGGFKARAAEGLGNLSEHGFKFGGSEAANPLGGVSMLAGAGGTAAQAAAMGKLAQETAIAEVATKKFNAAGLLMNPWVIGGTVAVTGLAVGLHHAAEVAKEFREADEALSVSLEISGKGAQISEESLRKYAAQISATTKFTRVQAQQAEGMLLSFRNVSGQQIPALLRLSADLAAKFGGDIADKARAVGLAMEEPEKGARALRQANVVLSDSELEKIKAWEQSGDVARAQEFIYERLTKKAEGYAAAVNHATYQMGHDWQEFENVFGKVVLKVEDGFAHVVLGAIDEVKNAWDEWPQDLKTLLTGQGPKYTPPSWADMLKSGDSTPFKGNGAAGEISDDQKARIARQHADLVAAEAEHQALLLSAQSSGWQLRLDQENARWRKLQEEDRKFGLSTVEDAKAHALKLADINIDESNKEFARQVAANEKMIALRDRFRNDQERSLVQFRQRETSATEQYAAQVAGRELARNDARRAAELEDFDRAQRLLADLDGIDLTYGENYIKYQEERTALVAAQSAERENDIRHEAEVQLEVDRKIAAANKQIANSYLAIAGVLAEAFNSGPLQVALQWLQRIQVVLEAINTIKTSQSIISTLLGATGLGAALGGGAAEVTGFAGGDFAAAAPILALAKGGSGSAQISRESSPIQSAPLAKGGSGGVTHTGPVIVQVTVPGGATKDQAAEIGHAISVGYMDALRAQEKRSRNVPYFRARGG